MRRHFYLSWICQVMRIAQLSQIWKAHSTYSKRNRAHSLGEQDIFDSKTSPLSSFVPFYRNFHGVLLLQLILDCMGILRLGSFIWKHKVCKMVTDLYWIPMRHCATTERPHIKDAQKYLFHYLHVGKAPFCEESKPNYQLNTVRHTEWICSRLFDEALKASPPSLFLTGWDRWDWKKSVPWWLID